MSLRLMDANYFFDSSVAITATSEDSVYPVSNLTKKSRAYPWRSSGYFKITTSNQKLDIKDAGGGSELTATLTTGDYTPTTLAAEIKTQLEAASAHTYTVTFSTLTGKWTIASNGSVLTLLTNTGTHIATSVWSALGFDVTVDHTGAVTYTGSNIALHTEERVTIDLSTTEAIDAFAILFDALDGIKMSQSATLTLQGNATNVWTAPSVSQAITPSETYDIALYLFGSDQSYRYWSLKIVDPANANLYVEIPKLSLCKSTVFGRGISMGFKPMLMDFTTIQRTPYGNKFGDVYPSLKSLEVAYAALAYADMESFWAIFKRLGKTTPFVVWLKDSNFTTEHFAFWGSFKDDFKPVHRIKSFMDLGCVLEEVY